jgi:signal transduction histidine kinase
VADEQPWWRAWESPLLPAWLAVSTVASFVAVVFAKGSSFAIAGVVAVVVLDVALVGFALEYRARLRSAVERDEAARRYLEDEALRLMQERREIKETYARDIIVRRDAEQQLQRALDEEHHVVLRLQELDRVKSEFVSSISHELRTPLTSTLGFLEMLADEEAGELNDEQRHMVQIATRNGQRLLALIEDLLTLSRIESGAFSVQYRPLVMNDVVREAAAEWMVKAKNNDIVFSLDIDDTDMGVLPGDERQILRALGNIIGNAVKFTPPGGSVTLTAKRRDDVLTLTVSDTGIGIPIEEQTKLFERFYRATPAVEQAFPGAGLGLTIARAVVEHHGGTIGIDSQPSIGTTVKIQLPALPSDARSVIDNVTPQHSD